MSIVVLTDEEEEKLDIVTKSIKEVIHNYLGFLLATTFPEKVEGAYIEVNRLRKFRKFKAVRKELFNFLSSHKHFFDLENVELVINDGKVIYRNEISILNSGEEFLEFNDILKLRDAWHNVCDDTKFKHVYDIKNNKVELLDAIKVKTGKSSVSIEDVQQFIKNSFLIDKNNLNTKCLSYKDFAAHISRRIYGYIKLKVSVEQINEMSFRFRGPIEGFEDMTSCPICMGDFEMDQEICRLPCNHFCCRVCTETMFSTPNEGVKSNVLCPVCRDDCT